MTHTIKLFFITLPIVIVLDLIWLGGIMAQFYQHELGMLARRMNGTFAPYLPTAVLVYVLMAAGLVIFVYPRVMPSVGLDTFLWGALYGFMVYGIYELTNYTILANWPIKLVIVDTAWGAFLFGVTSYSTLYIAHLLNRT